jgi:hypothetical protein
VLNDPNPGDGLYLFSTLFVAGAITIRAACVDDQEGSGIDFAGVGIQGPPSSFAGWRNDGAVINSPEGGAVSIAGAGSSGNVTSGGFVTAVAPNGDVVTVSGSAEVGDPAGDCVFGVTAIGP